MIVRRPIPLILLLAACCAAPGQTLKQYLALRKQYGIRQAVEVPALETMVGTRVMELQGKVKGTFQVGNRFSLLLERTDGRSETVDSDSVPDWLQMNDVRARLIVRATRADETSPIRAVLIAAAAEDQIAPIEEAEARRALEEARRKARPDPRTASFASTQIPKEWSLPSAQACQVYAAYIKRVNPRLANSQALEIATGIIGFSLRYGVDARLIMAMVMTESSFKPGEKSRAGAMGLGQLMPSNVREMGLTNAYDTTQNLYATVKLVRGHLSDYDSKFGGRTFQSLVLALAAYNAGPGAVRRYGGVPPYRETQNYVDRVLRLFYEFAGRDARNLGKL